MKYILVHDLGTSGNKTVLFGVDGRIIASKTTDYPTQYLQPHGVEQNPEDWWDAVCSSTKSVLAKIHARDIVAVSLSGHMQGMVCIDRNGELLYPSMIWMDQRAEHQTKRLIDEMSLQGIYKITGHRASPVYTLEKIMWLKDHEPEIYSRIYKVINTKDYIIFKLTGEILTDYSDASGTNALDIHQKRWSSDILSVAGINPNVMPELRESTDIAGYVTNSAAASCGLLAGTPVVCGGGDGACATVGAGCVEKDSMYCCMGTSAWIASTADQPLLDEKMALFNFVHMIPNRYIPCGAMSSCGTAYHWAVEAFMQDAFRASEKTYKSIHDYVEQEVSKIAGGSKGLIFLPYLHGERSPRWNPDARGVMFGLTAAHTNKEMMRSVLEGVVYNLTSIIREFPPDSKNKALMLIGGSTNPLWTQILCDVSNRPVSTIKSNRSATAIGAAVAAGVGTKEYREFSIVRQFIEQDATYLPIQSNVENYDKIMNIFENLYINLEEIFCLAAI